MAYRARGAYFRDGLLTVHDASFLRDTRFLEAYQLAKQTGSFGTWEPMWRTYICCWAAKVGCALEGDFVECGVNLGGFSRAVAHYVDLEQLDKRFWLLDTFSGVVEGQITPEERRKGTAIGKYSECFQRVQQNFAGLKNIHFVRGVVPDTLSRVDASQVCYLSIDMNAVYPEIAAAEFFWDKLSPGAIVVLDDYGWAKHTEQRIAFDQFAQRKSVHVLAMPTGQGLMLKPRA
jgi:hypothetical protein